jgi:hypothetical protein
VLSFILSPFGHADIARKNAGEQSDGGK